MIEITVTVEQYAMIRRGFPLIPMKEKVADGTQVRFCEEGTDRSVTVTTQRCLDCVAFVPGLYMYSYDKRHEYNHEDRSCICGCSAESHCGDKNCPHCSQKSLLNDLLEGVTEKIIQNPEKMKGLLERMKKAQVFPPLLLTGNNIDAVKEQIRDMLPFEIEGLEAAATFSELYEVMNADPRISIVAKPMNDETVAELVDTMAAQVERPPKSTLQ